MAIKTYQKTSTAKLSENFKVSEFACNGVGCCSTVKIDTALVSYLQKIRDYFGATVTINSGYRCETHNKAVGGATGSKHRLGMAADIVVKGVKPAEVAKYAESIGILGIGLYETASDGYFVHIDTRTTKAFWYGQKQAYRSTFGGAPKKPYSGKFPVLPEKGYLKKGDTGAQVVRLQNFLNWYGSYGLKSDGDFGIKTENAVKAFQKANGLKVDGQFGVKSLAKAKTSEK